MCNKRVYISDYDGTYTRGNVAPVFFFGNSSAWCVCMADYRAHIQVLGVVTFEMSKFLIKNV